MNLSYSSLDPEPKARFSQMRLPCIALIGLLLTLSPSAVVADNSLPSFLPDYFAPAVALKEDKLHLERHAKEKNVDRYLYVSDDRGISLAIENVECNRTTCPMIFDNTSKIANQQATQHGGAFKFVTNRDFRADWQDSSTSNTVFVFTLPQSVLFWSYRSIRTPAPEARFDSLRSLINQLRYAKAESLDNVEQGSWAPQFHELAKRLLAEGKTEEALAVLKTVVIAAPENYRAQLDLANATSDPALKRHSAEAVFDNAENPDLIDQAAAILGLARPTIEEEVPVLPSGAKGLQVILIPLEPCDVRLLQDAASVFEKITNIPTHLFRLREQWSWGEPDRVPNQRIVQQMLAGELGLATDFSDWTLDQYIDALNRSVEGKDALSKYFILAFIDEFKRQPGQYLVDRHLLQFLDLLGNYRSPDVKTAYVGVTSANIYGGDTNFIFSSFSENSSGTGSIVSYAMMTAEMSGDSVESRRRLVERLAKEMVPARCELSGGCPFGPGRES